MTERGGYQCPHCPHREFTDSMIRQHIRTAHPDQENP